MITLSKKIKEEKEKKEKGLSPNESRKGQRISVRDALLIKGNHRVLLTDFVRRNLIFGIKNEFERSLILILMCCYRSSRDGRIFTW